MRLCIQHSLTGSVLIGHDMTPCAAQFAAAKLGVWNSEWSDVYDFSQKKGGIGADGADVKLNWSLLPATTKVNELLKLDVTGLEKEGVSDGSTEADRVVPLTIGRGGGVYRPKTQSAFVAAFQSDAGFEFLNKIKDKVILATRALLHAMMIVIRADLCMI
jgi:hypothetical protein